MSDTIKRTRDEDNPEFIFQMINTTILTAIVNGKIDPVYLAKKQLANRGLDKDGNWIGFKEAKKAYNLK